jgi:hypothetical protein
MLKVNPEVIKVYRQHLIKIIKELVKPYLKDSEYREGILYGTGKPTKLCLLKRPVRLNFLIAGCEGDQHEINFVKASVKGFTDKEVVLDCSIDLETISFSKICLDDLQILAKLKLDSLVKVEKPKRS